jgi:hypothetical protein
VNGIELNWPALRSKIYPVTFYKIRVYFCHDDDDDDDDSSVTQLERGNFPNVQKNYEACKRLVTICTQQCAKSQEMRINSGEIHIFVGTCYKAMYRGMDWRHTLSILSDNTAKFRRTPVTCLHRCRTQKEKDLFLRKERGWKGVGRGNTWTGFTKPLVFKWWFTDSSAFAGISQGFRKHMPLITKLVYIVTAKWAIERVFGLLYFINFWLGVVIQYVLYQAVFPLGTRRGIETQILPKGAVLRHSSPYNIIFIIFNLIYTFLLILLPIGVWVFISLNHF